MTVDRPRRPGDGLALPSSGDSPENPLVTENQKYSAAEAADVRPREPFLGPPQGGSGSLGAGEGPTDDLPQSPHVRPETRPLAENFRKDEPDDAAGEQDSEPRPDAAELREIPEPLTESPLRAVIDGLATVRLALERVDISWDDAVAELVAARADGRATGISDEAFRHVITDLRPELAQALGQVTGMREAAALGAEPSPVETAQLGSQLTEASETAELVRRELPRSGLWRLVTTGLRTAVRAVTSVLVMLAHAEVKGISVTLTAGLPFNVAQAQVTFDLKPPPRDPGASPGRAATPEP